MPSRLCAPSKRPRRSCLIEALLVVAALVLVSLGATVILRDSASARSYADLSASFVAPGDAADGGESRPASDTPAVAVDWGSLLAQNSSTCAWLSVEGTTVDVPVVASSAADPDFWLYRDFWGGSSDTGVPYLDCSCEPDGEVMVVYGHRTSYVSYMFHDISPLYDQGPFDSVGEALWSTQAGGTTRFAPLCAASVDMGDTWWTGAGAAEGGGLREWLAQATSKASARSADAEKLIGSAERALVLVTCNGRAFKPTTRTVAVFVA